MIDSLINLNLCISHIHTHTHTHMCMYMHGRAHLVTRVINWRFVEAACVAAYGQRWVCAPAPALPSCPLDQVCLLQERASYSPFEAPHDVVVVWGVGLVLASYSYKCVLCHHPTTSSFPVLASLRSSFEPN
ncbi:hypothetical protein TorRG33x02_055940 [Trema orientale]|uniref:Uncharacterized protein n=1 Tax=Trema orientale TaxID=63057 RepID=A0A2P5FLN7_TREOI|nr:hypothetical protein TorRG33x02_055940 [Trema orientale]